MATKTPPFGIAASADYAVVFREIERQGLNA